MRILALDPATRCGWAHSEGGSGEWGLKARGKERTGIRLVRFRERLAHVSRTQGIDFVAFEGVKYVMPGMLAGALAVAEVVGVIKLYCEEKHIDYREYNPTTIKKHATGKGNANKAKMLAAARERFGIVKTDNEADALWILDLARTDLAITAD